MQETVILEGVCNRIKGAFVENGHAMLTNQRLRYQMTYEQGACNPNAGYRVQILLYQTGAMENRI